MICASCDRPIPESGVVCPRCNPPEPRENATPVSHHELARSVRLLKGLVLLSVMFGLIAAPFAIYVATRALHRYRRTGLTDPATRRQLVIMRRIAVGLLIFWALAVAVRFSWVMPLQQ